MRLTAGGWWCWGCPRRWRGRSWRQQRPELSAETRKKKNIWTQGTKTELFFLPRWLILLLSTIISGLTFLSLHPEIEIFLDTSLMDLTVYKWWTFVFWSSSPWCPLSPTRLWPSAGFCIGCSASHTWCRDLFWSGTAPPRRSGRQSGC